MREGNVSKKRTSKAIRADLQQWMNDWIEQTQDGGDALNMWVHDDLPKQMADACILVIDACRESQNFTRKQEA